MIKPLLATTLFFSFLFIFPAFAYYPIITNASIAQYSYTIKCLNESGTFYCYSGKGGTGITTSIVRVNTTGGNLTNCAITGIPGGAGATPSIFGLSIPNSTYAKVAISNYCLTVDISNITGGTCPVSKALATGFDFEDCAHYGIYQSGDFSGQYGFYAQNGTVFYSTNFTWGGNFTSVPYWIPTSIAPHNYTYKDVFFPNRSDNTTLYVLNASGTGNMVVKNLYKYVNGVYDSTIMDFNSLWGINNSNTYISLVKMNASTTLGFLMHTVDNTHAQFYMVNFSKVENVTDTTSLSGIYPIGNLTISQAMNPTVQLNAFLDTVNDGTVVWYIDNVAIGNTTITAPYYNDVYFSSQILAAGQHYWNATFYDNLSVAWSTNTNSFFMAPTSAITTVAQSMANALGVSLANGKVFFGLLIAAALSGALAYWVKWQLFLPSMLVCTICLAFIGFFPAWMTVVIVVIASAIFAKYAKLI